MPVKLLFEPIPLRSMFVGVWLRPPVVNWGLVSASLGFFIPNVLYLIKPSLFTMRCIPDFEPVLRLEMAFECILIESSVALLAFLPERIS